MRSMKDLSFFLLKNSFGAKMRKGFRTFCNDDGSTSTLNQRQNNSSSSVILSSPTYDNHADDRCNHGHLDNDQMRDDTSTSSSRLRAGANNNDKMRKMPLERRARRRTSPPPPPASRGMTLEEMILKLEMEEENAAKQQEANTSMLRGGTGRRSSCVNNCSSDNLLLMSARDALNQYPRFSLDGKDAMYRSSFRNNATASSRMGMAAARRSVCCDYGVVQRMRMNNSAAAISTTLAGESVVWCKPGVVAKLMGLEALPMPLRTATTASKTNINHLHPRRDPLLVLGTSHRRRACPATTHDHHRFL